MARILKLTLFLLPFTLNILLAQDFPDKPSGFVNDYARVLTPAERTRLEGKLSQFRNATSNVIVISTVKNLRGLTIEEFSLNMFEKWKMWEGDRKNGVLILISTDDRRMRVHVGYGLEGALPDALAGRVVNDIMSPFFREGQFFAGLDRATSAIMEATAGEFDAVEAIQRHQPESEKSGGIPLDLIIYAFFIIVFFVLPRVAGRRGRSFHRGGVVIFGPFGGGGFGGGRGFGGGGGFGGFSGGGGFGSGGGGASGSW